MINFNHLFKLIEAKISFIDAKVRIGLSGGLASYLCSHLPFFNNIIASSFDVIVKLLGFAGLLLGLFSAYFGFRIKRQELRKTEIETAILEMELEKEKKKSEKDE